LPFTTVCIPSLISCHWFCFFIKGHVNIVPSANSLRSHFNVMLPVFCRKRSQKQMDFVLQSSFSFRSMFIKRHSAINLSFPSSKSTLFYCSLVLVAARDKKISHRDLTFTLNLNNQSLNSRYLSLQRTGTLFWLLCRIKTG